MFCIGGDIIKLKNKKIRFYLTNEFKINNAIISEIENIEKEEEAKISIITNQKQIKNIDDEFDILAIVPCDEKTTALLSYNLDCNYITKDVRKHLSKDKPVVIGIYAIDGLSGNAENIGKLLNRNNCFFIPFKQSNPITKPRAISFSILYIKQTLEYSLDKIQIQPILL